MNKSTSEIKKLLLASDYKLKVKNRLGEYKEKKFILINSPTEFNFREQLCIGTCLITNVIFNFNFDLSRIDFGKITSEDYIQFCDCIFLCKVDFSKANISIYNSYLLSDVNFTNCNKSNIGNCYFKKILFKEKNNCITISDNIYDYSNTKIVISSNSDICTFYGKNLELTDFSVMDASLKKIRLEKIVINNILELQKTNISELYNFMGITINKEASYIINDCILNSQGSIKFEKIYGYIQIYKTILNNCMLDYEILNERNYAAIRRNKSQDEKIKLIKWTFLNISEIFKTNNKINEYLATYRQFKKYDIKEEMHKRNKKNKILYFPLFIFNIILDHTTGYFTSMKKIIITSISIIIAFSIFG